MASWCPRSNRNCPTVLVEPLLARCRSGPPESPSESLGTEADGAERQKSGFVPAKRTMSTAPLSSAAPATAHSSATDAIPAIIIVIASAMVRGASPLQSGGTVEQVLHAHRVPRAAACCCDTPGIKGVSHGAQRVCPALYASLMIGRPRERAHDNAPPIRDFTEMCGP
jgi:hypothetical protein